MTVGGQRHVSAALPQERDPTSIIQEAGWPPGSVRMRAENLAPTAIQPSNGPTQYNEKAIPALFYSVKVQMVTIQGAALLIRTRDYPVLISRPGHRI